MKIGERIKQRREELGMSQEELAKTLGYKSRSSVNKIENDASGLPQNKIVDIARALKTTPSHIMGWEEVQQKNSDLATAILRARSNDKLLSVILKASKLTDDQLDGLDAMLATLFQ